MTNGIYLVGKGKVNAGRIEAARNAMGEVVNQVRQGAAGVAIYEHAIEAQTGLWTGIEKYTDSDALKAHLSNPKVGQALGVFMQDLAVEGIVVIGDVSAEVKAMMSPFKPTYLGSSLGFARHAAQEVVGRAP